MTGPERRPDAEPPTELERAVAWLDQRTGLGGPMRALARKVFPDHWSFLLGELALFCFILLVATGTFLALFFVPDGAERPYAGSYAPLQATPVSGAFDSVMRLSFDVAPGLLFRQMHHWTALLFVGAICVHLARVFVTAAFRRPRELNWVIGVGLLLFAVAEGLTGYSLPDDLLSGTGIRIGHGVLVSVPFVGPGLADLLFGGPFPGTELVNRLFVVHVFLIPALLVGGIAAHVGLVFVQRHSQYRRGAAREDNVVGLPFWPQQAFRSGGLLLLTAAIVGLLAGLVQINPVWLYGPYRPFEASTPAQPDWYIGWLEGLLRMSPSIELRILGVTIPQPFLPAIVVPAIASLLLIVWPWLDRRLTGDRAEHHLLAAWWEQPRRIAAGAWFATAFVVCTVAGANDAIGGVLSVPVPLLTRVFIVAVVVLPVAAALGAWIAARERHARQAREGRGVVTERASSAVLVRNTAGGFDEAES